jgi:23S rRNA (cytidine1920-2'-O)/16S rRNA (cytidine1409-2'-O)-methyltransferase
VATRRRLDAELVRRGLAPSREAAGEAVAAGTVLVGGAVASKPSHLVAPGDAVSLLAPARTFASRGGDKLDPVLDRLGVEVAGRRCLDAGASTGGFTDVLLRRGAVQVAAVDVGYGQLQLRLRDDERVLVLDRTNVRNLTAEAIGGPVDLVVADLSFISLTTVLDALAACLSTTTGRAELVLLVKPQFEVGRQAAERGRGVIRDPALWAEAVGRVAGAAAALGLGVAGLCPSPRPGPAGNVEFFLHLRRGAGPIDPALLEEAVADGQALAQAPGGRR